MHHSLPTVSELAVAVAVSYAGALVMLVARRLAGDPTAKAQSDDVFFSALGFFAVCFALRFLTDF
jgi:hypothetical protein